MERPAHIHVKGAREHNLRNLELRIPRGKLVVVTGPSGSGKSSLAFDTIYAEGHRKYMESLSTRARQELERLRKPDVDFIHGLSPVLAIEQRTGGPAPRSTVATVTELADYAALLWTLAGEQRCPDDGGRVSRRSLDENVDLVLREADGRRAMVLAPLGRLTAAALREELPRLRQRGFQRVRIDGVARNLDEPDAAPSRAGAARLELVVDRIVAGAGQRSRLADSLELAFREGRDRAIVLVEEPPKKPGAGAAASSGWREIALSQALSCEVCGTVFEALSARDFSFNHSRGACPECGGLGKTRVFLPELLVPDTGKSVREGAVKAWRLGGKSLIIRHNALLKQLAEQLPFDAETPWRELPESARAVILRGGGERLFRFKLRRMREPKSMPFPGVIADLEKSFRETDSEGFRARLMTYMMAGVCPACRGGRLNARSAAARLGGISFVDFLGMDVRAALEWTRGAANAPASRKTADPGAAAEVMRGLEQRLRFLDETGLGYLTLDRDCETLSGGEAQRVRLATQLGMGLTGVIYVLDEPSVGLHPSDNAKLLEKLKELRDTGNTVLVVEHDGETMRAADEIIELGPGAGGEGGGLLFQGTPRELARGDTSTGLYLSGRLRIGRTEETGGGAGRSSAGDGRFLRVLGASEHNLRDVSAGFPVGALTCVTGVSGSGKSTLVNDVLAAAAARRLNRAKTLPGAHRRVEGLEFFERLVRVDQSPIGRSPRSNPATFTGLMDVLRDLFAKLPLAKARGYKAGRFSFNMRGGRCEKCQGDGEITMDMLFMADARAVCPSCEGRRFNRETLDVLFHGRSIADILEMRVREAARLLANIPRAVEKLGTLEAVGLGYLALGQSAATLSGGEAQRMKLSLELGRRQRGGTLYILDEPTTGLHWTDIQHLMNLLFRLRAAGNTLIVIEHNPDVIHLADWIVDLGPGGGREGGRVVYEGPRDGLERAPGSLTGSAMAAWRREMETAERARA
ncbi:MAG: excinuclease ABC subunit UvrA [Opitutaceae bacterium]|jgi:excinuclease ABC subunit A|nr:excinuclease ABC subunit UvrA [Opitutaceae bacterium]